MCLSPLAPLLLQHVEQASELALALLLRLDDAGYDRVGADVPAPQRAELLALRRDALEELSWSAT